MPDKDGKKSSSNAPSRLDRYKSDGVLPQYPPIDAGAHLINYLFEIGPGQAGSMGEGQLSHCELRAWQENMGIELQPWETQLIRRLSGEYLSQLHKSADPDCKPPFGTLYRAPNLSKKIDDALD